MRAMRHIGSWGLALFLIFMFVQATIHPLPNPPLGSVKLFDPPGQNIVFVTLAEKTQIPLFEPTGRVFVAIGELVAALLLLLPFTRKLGAGNRCRVSFDAVRAGTRDSAFTRSRRLDR